MKLLNQLFVYSLILSLSTQYACKKKEVLTLKTTDITDIQVNSATSGGTVINSGGTTILTCGVCWSTGAAPTVADHKTEGSYTNSNFTSLLTGLEAGTSYWVRAYATNSEGTWYGNQVYFATYPELPSITTDISSITPTSAVGTGHLIYGNGVFVQKVGICFSKTKNPTIDNNFIECKLEGDSFSADLKQLIGGVSYYVRAYVIVSIAANSHLFIVYGNQVSFVAGPVLPTVIIRKVSSVSMTSATVEAEVVNNGGDSLMSRGICLDTLNSPTINSTVFQTDSDQDLFTVTLTDLKPATEYNIKAYSVNSVGVGYSDQFKIITKYGTLTDISGNSYEILRIGSQVWMAENLKTTIYNDGTIIPLVSDATEWINLSTPGYCWFNDDESTNKADNGALYNWYTVGTGKLCPIGWHVPSEEDWTILTDYFGGTDVAGGKLKEIGLTHWLYPNKGATNESGFTALPSGIRSDNGEFIRKGELSAMWSSTLFDESNTNYPFYRYFSKDYSSVYVGFTFTIFGLSVRCIQD